MYDNDAFGIHKIDRTCTTLALKEFNMTNHLGINPAHEKISWARFQQNGSPFYITALSWCWGCLAVKQSRWRTSRKTVSENLFLKSTVTADFDCYNCNIKVNVFPCTLKIMHLKFFTILSRLTQQIKPTFSWVSYFLYFVDHKKHSYTVYDYFVSATNPVYL